jgi:hypothetical protein
MAILGGVSASFLGKSRDPIMVKIGRSRGYFKARPVPDQRRKFPRAAGLVIPGAPRANASVPGTGKAWF